MFTIINNCPKVPFLVFCTVLSCTASDGASVKQSTPPKKMEVPGAAVETSAPPEQQIFEHWMFPSASIALSYVLNKTSPRVVGFGEIHQQNATTEINSAVSKFTSSLLPAIAGKVSDLVIETWVVAGNCGASEEQVTKDISETTERPETTEDETVALINRATALNIQPHVLQLECEDYKLVEGGKEGVDYLLLLELIEKKIESKALEIIDWRGKTSKKAKPIIAIYGGAIHNDTNPEEALRSVSYGPALSKIVGGLYVEVDLIVPEFAKSSKIFSSQPWFSMLEKFASKKQILLIKKSEGSYILVFETSQ